ncbi:MAG: shikimate dehydrogenase [Robiginitomaculum sp.]|nr:shikimate dehydrogenase [Robiginitomaculum sp.]
MAQLLKMAGVAGWPVHHSLSPVLHNYWLRHLGIKAAYTMFAVHPNEAIYAFKTLKKTTIEGLNVTIPLKGLAFQAADEITPDAVKLGVCNVLYKRGGKLIGHNTDMEGFAAPLLEHVGHHHILNNAVTLVGAGGAARAVLGSLLALGAPEIRIINRSDERAKNLATHINIPNLYACDWSDRQSAIMGAGLVINASAAGMAGNDKLDIDVGGMMKDSWVYDLVYTPMVTPLIKQAEKHGLRTIGGLEMLIAQARPSFKLFYGCEPPKNIGARDMLIKYLKAAK